MVKYEIYVTKDHSTVVVDYRLGTDIGQTELIADFSVFVDGKNIITSPASGCSIFTGSESAVIDEARDVPVAFAVSSNTGWTANGEDTLRKDHPFDSSRFSN
jgi:hypothetical protein